MNVASTPVMMLASPRALRRVRAISLVAALFVLGCITAMFGREFGVRLPGAYASIGNGCLVVGVRDVGLDQSDPWSPDLTLGPLYLRRTWQGDWAFAWRPFHVRVDAADGSVTRQGLAVPLWPVLIGGLLLAGYAHGYLVALRRTRTTHCRTCGYDLRSVMRASGSEAGDDAPAAIVTCPECGAKQASGKRAEGLGPRDE